jgi:hypothetical protein
MMTTFLALSVSASVKERPRSKGVQDLEELWTDIGELGEELLLCGIGLVRQRERDRLVGIIHQRDAIVASHGNFFNTGQGRKTVDAVNKDIPITHLEPMQLLVDRAHSESRFASLLATLLGVIALVLATSGIYGVLSYSVAQGTTEIGIRMAIGAPRAQVLRMILADGFARILPGLLAGFLLCLAVTPLLAQLL